MNVTATLYSRSLETPQMRKLVVLAMMAASMVVAACNTVEGAGRDVSAAGKAVTNTADDAKH